MRARKPGDEGHLHAPLTQAYATGGSSIPAFGTWRRELFEVEEFDSRVVFAGVVEDDGRLLGAAQCWTSAFVKDLAVRDDQRRMGSLISVHRERPAMKDRPAGIFHHANGAEFYNG